MDLSTVIGLLLGFGALIAAILIDGGSPLAYGNISAATIVFGGTFGATLIAFPLERVKLLPKLIMKALMGKAADAGPYISLFVRLAEKARRDGLLSLEEDVQKLDDESLKKGLLLVVDGSDPDLVRDVMERDLMSVAERHESGYGMLEAMGGFAPTMGIIGTVMGLIQVLSSLEDPSGLSEAIAVAFIATLYGVGTANLLWLPLGAKLKNKSKLEAQVRELMIEGVLSIQAGDNPRIVKEKLEAFLAPAHRALLNKEADGKSKNANMDDAAQFSPRTAQ